MTRALLLATAAAVLLTGCRPSQNIGEGFAGLSNTEKSLFLEVSADSVLSDGATVHARDLYLQAALLRQPGDPDRTRLARQAASASRTRSVACARLLLENPDSLAAFTALAIGGSEVAADLMYGLARREYPLPEYLCLAAAESLLAAGEPGFALEFLRLVPAGLPGRASRDRLVALYTATLRSGDGAAADSVLLEASGYQDDPEIVAELLHARGMATAGEPGWRDDLLESFRLWPAGDMHASAFAVLRDNLLADSALASEVADPFYSVGCGTSCTTWR